MKRRLSYPLAGLLLLAVLCALAVPARAAVSSSAYTARTTDDLNMHSSMVVTDTNKLQVIPSGKIVSILSREKDSWYRVQYGTVIGYVKGGYLEDNPDLYETKENTRLRSSMDSSSTKNLIGTVRAGRQVEQIELMSGGWMHVNYRGWIGYMRTASLKPLRSAIDLKNVKFENIVALYNGKAKALPKVENLPDGVNVTYDTTEKPKNIGVYEVTASFSPKNSADKLTNASPRTATLTIGVKQGTNYMVNNMKYTIIQEQIDGTGTVKISGSKYKSIKTLTVPDKVRIGGTFFKVTAVKKLAFSGMKKLEKVELGNNVKTIGSNAFRFCDKLSFVILGKKVEKIGFGAFYKDPKLTRVTIRSKVMDQVGQKCFEGIAAKAAIKVPAAKLKVYTKLLQEKSGAPKTVKIH